MANPPGYSEAAPYTSSILSKQRLLELSSPRSSDWLKLLGTLLVDSFSLIMMTALLGNLMRHCMEPTNILCIANNNAQWCNQSSVFMVSSVPLKHRWAARVLVNSDEACIHGQKVGIRYWTSKPSCKIFKASELESSGWMGPLVKLSLPSFSGRTKYNRHLLKYSCQIECRVRAVAPAKVLGPPPPAVDVDEERSCRELRKKKRSLSVSVLLSKPILALQFNRLEMKVEAPTTVCKR
ncbi:protein NEOXANTHIN-DEFICIENT 1-like isoform X6 [Coffea arabica]|uniref:Protein NEOXANTHIN-DEFICIENT 1-like isoform X6 n=1 Tax=Coffea arabica TaxID=13443 RepID=A0ABM4W548_COFAR